MAEGAINAELYFVVVMHNGSCASSLAFTSLRESGARPERVLLVDNSTGEYGIRSAAIESGFGYVDMGGNRGLPRAYNRALVWLKAHSVADHNPIVVWLDDDTRMTAEYIERLEAEQAARPEAKVFLPVVSDDKTVQSPCRALGLHIFRSRNPRRISAASLSAINTGMAVRLAVYDRISYNDALFLDYVDHSFMRRVRELRMPVAMLDVTLRHGFYDNTNHERGDALERTLIYLHDLRVFCEGEPLGTLYRVFKTVYRGLKLCLRYRDNRFLTTALRCLIGRDTLPIYRKSANLRLASRIDDPVDISALILTHNHARTISGAVGSLLANTRRMSLSLIVADNGSTDGTVNLVRTEYPDVPVIAIPNHGFAAGQNAVLDRLNSRYHAIVNPDITFHGDMLSRMAAYMDNHPGVGLLSPRILHPDGTEQVLGKREPRLRYLVANRLLGKRGWPLVREYAMMDEDMSRPRDIEYASGSFMLVRTDVFRTLKGFDERFFMYFEDCDLSRRIRNLGYRVVYNPDVSVYHEWQRADIGNVRLLLIHIQTMFQYFSKWGWRV